ILEQGRELLGRLRLLDATLATADAADPLAKMYRDIAAMTSTTLRMLQALPDAASVQLRLCEGLEALVGVIAGRLATLGALVEQPRRETEPLDRLTELLTALAQEESADVQAFVALAESIVTAAQQSAPLRFVHAEAKEPVRFVAGHSLNV